MALSELIVIVLGAFIVNGVFYAGRMVLQPADTTISVQTPVGEIVGKLETITFDGTEYNVSEFLGIP